MDVLESGHMMDARLAYTVAVAALHANTRADVAKGSDTAFEMYQDAVNSIPYCNVGVKATGAMSEREDAVRRYRAMVASGQQEAEITKG